MSHKLTITIEVTEDDLAAVAFVIDRDRGHYDDPRRPRDQRPTAAQPAIVERRLAMVLRSAIHEAGQQARSHDQMVKANTRRP